MLFSWLHWIVFWCFRVSLKNVFCIYHVHCRSPCLWGQVLDDCDPLVASCFLDFSHSLKFCVAIFTFDIAVSYQGSLLIAFRREIPSFSPASYSEAFSAFVEYTCFVLLLPSCGGILKLVCLFFFFDPARYLAKCPQTLLFLQKWR